MVVMMPHGFQAYELCYGSWSQAEWVMPPLRGDAQATLARVMCRSSDCGIEGLHMTYLLDGRHLETSVGDVIWDICLETGENG